MPVGSAANSDTFAVTTPSDDEIRLTRLFAAPRELVFAAMTEPEHVKRWWGNLGDGYSVPVCEIDLRPGGARCCPRSERRPEPQGLCRTGSVVTVPLPPTGAGPVIHATPLRA